MKSTEIDAVVEYVAEVARLAKTGRTTEHSHIKLDMALRECCQCGNVANTNSNSQLGTGNIGTGNTGNIGNTSICRVYINPTQYFDNVPLGAWEQAIGGYHPAEKWLKDCKGRALTQDDLKHYQHIILVLVKTHNVMEGMLHGDESA